MTKHTFSVFRRLKIFLFLASLLVTSSVTTTTVAQTQSPAKSPAPRQTPLPTSTQTPAQTSFPAPANTKSTTDKVDGDATFDTLIAADSYAIYGEIRNINQLNRTLLEFLQPATQLGDASSFSKEFFSITQISFAFYKAHEKDLEGSRQMFASLSVREGLPETISAIELATPEAAEKFAADFQKFSDTQLKEMNAKLSANVSEDKDVSTSKPDDKNKAPTVNFIVKRIGALVVFTNQLINLKALRPKDSLPINANPQFQNARSRFSDDTFFLYYDQTLMSKKYERIRAELESKQTEAQKAAIEADAQKAANESANAAARVTNEAQTTTSNSASTSVTTTSNVTAMNQPTTTVEDEEPPPAAPSNAKSSDAQTPNGEPKKQGVETTNANAEVSNLIQSIIFGAGRNNRESSMPQAIGLGAKITDDSLNLRVLLISNPNAPMSVLPYFFTLPAGLPVTADAPPLVPDDADIILRTSIDATRLYETFIASSTSFVPYETSSPTTEQTSSNKNAQETAQQIVALEKLLGFSIKDDLLPSLGNEVVLMIPASELLGVKAAKPRTPNKSKEESEQAGYAVFITLNNADKMRSLIQRAGLFLGFTGSEKYNDADVFTSATGVISIIDNSLIVAPDVTTMRHIIDSRRNARTVNSSLDFTTATDWQQRLTLMQVYVSKSLLKRYFDHERTDLESFDPQVKDYLARFSSEPAAITHTATTDGIYIMHELHLPKSVLMTFIAQESAGSKTSPIRSGEMSARYRLGEIQRREETYLKAHNRYASLADFRRKDFKAGEQEDEYVEDGAITSAFNGYKFDVAVSGNDFTATAVPKEYGKTGRRSYFIDKSGVLRGADHKGKSASADDPVIEQE